MSVSMTANALCTLFSILVILRVSPYSCERFVIVVVAATILALVLDHVCSAGGASAAAVEALSPLCLCSADWWSLGQCSWSAWNRS